MHIIYWFKLTQNPHILQSFNLDDSDLFKPDAVGGDQLPEAEFYMRNL